MAVKTTGSVARKMRCGFLAVAVVMVQAVGSAAAQSPRQDAAPEATSPPPRSSPRQAAQAARRANPGNLVGHGGPIKAIGVDAERGLALTGSFDYAMMLWDVSGDAPRLVHRFEDHGGAVNAVAFVPGSRRALAVAAGDDGKIALWDLDSHRLIHRFAGHESKIVGLAVTPDGRWAASAGWDRTARLWNLESLQEGPVLTEHKGPVNAVAFSVDGQRLYTAGADGLVGLWDAGSGRFERPLYRHGWGVNVLERLPGGEQMLIGALNGTAAIIDGTTGEVVRELQSSERPVLSVAAIDKPGLIATGSGDGVIRVFRNGDHALIEEHQNPYGPVWAMGFLAGGARMYWGGLDDFATLWQVSPRAAFEPVAGDFPRRFQMRGRPGDLLDEGEIQFARKCNVCHTLEPDGRNRAGPTLHKIFGRRIATLPGYPYSEPLKQLDIVWTEETIGRLFEQGPDVVTPGSKMPLQRITDARQRAALIAYLKAAAVDAAPPATPESQQKGDPK